VVTRKVIAKVRKKKKDQIEGIVIYKSTGREWYPGRRDRRRNGERKKKKRETPDVGNWYTHYYPHTED